MGIRANRKPAKGTERLVCTIVESEYDPERGYRACIVVEGEDGYHPTGNWPYGASKGHVMPWFFGHDLEKARARAQERNDRLGISAEDAARIVMDSIMRGVAASKRDTRAEDEVGE